MTLKFVGSPMSSVLRAHNLVKGMKEDGNLWVYYPLHPGGSIEPLKSSAEVIDQLIADGYQQTSEELRSVFGSQCFDIRETKNPEGESTYWVRGPVDALDETPAVILCMTIDNCPPPGENALPMLNPLPLPQFGERGYVLSADPAIPSQLYTIDQLPTRAQARWAQLRSTLFAFSQPLKWPLFTERHYTVSDPVRLTRKKNSITTRQNLYIAGQQQADSILDDALLQTAQGHIQELHEMLNKSGWDDQWKEIQRMAYQLAKDYADFHDKQHTKPAPPIINAFALGTAPVCSAGPVLATLESIQNAASGADRWEHTPGQTPFYRYSKEAGQTIVEYGREEPTEIIRDDAAANLWKEVKAFDDYDADVLLAVIAQIIKNDGEPAWFGASQFLDNRGIIPVTKKEGSITRRAGHRVEDIDRVRDALIRISKLWVRIEEVIPPRRKGQKPRKYVHHGRVITIGETWTQETVGLVDSEGYVREKLPVAWRIRAGDWMMEYLDAPRMVAMLCEKSLQYHPTKEIWEKRLSRYFMFHLRINARHASSKIVRRVGLLIHDLSLPADERNPERTRKRFEQAMNKLVADQQIDAWEYKEQPQLPPRKWLDQWQEWQVNVYARARLKGDQK